MQRDFEVSAKVQGSEAAAVDSVLAARFASPFSDYAVLVAAGVPPPATPEGHALLVRMIGTADTVTGVTATLSYLTAGDTLFRADRGTFIIVGLDAGRGRLDAYVPKLRTATAGLAHELASTYPGATLRWTGNAPINYDIRTASGREARKSELRVLPVTLLLLVLAFGGLAASVLPIVSAGMAVVTALGVAALINFAFPLSVLLQNIASMIGLGVGLDYALLTVSRFREARAAGMTGEEAAVEACRFDDPVVGKRCVDRVCGPRHVGLLFVASGSIRILKTYAIRYFPSIDFSPDGRYAVYEHPALGDSGERDIFILDTSRGFSPGYDGREARLVTRPADDRHPRFTPDGRGVLFFSRGATGEPICAWYQRIVDGKPQGSPELVREDMGATAEPIGFSSDGSFYYHINSDSLNMRAVWVMENFRPSAAR